MKEYHQKLYLSWLLCVSKKNSTYLLELEKRKVDRFVEKWEKEWGLTGAEERALRRAYQIALQRLERFDEAASAMEDLLNLYPQEELKSAQAVEDGRRCILQVNQKLFSSPTLNFERTFKNLNWLVFFL